MGILLISRSYPPTKGGMEKYSYELAQELKNRFSVKTIANTRGKKYLPVFMLFLLPRAIYCLCRNKTDIVILTDSTLAPFGYFLSKLFRPKVVCLAHGLDIIYDRIWYQKLLLPFVRKMDLVVANSEATESECRRRGIKKTTVIHCGIHSEKLKNKIRKANKYQGLEKLDITNKKILLSVGHLVERKGFFWFAQNVMPDLPREYVYVVIGGPGNNPGARKKRKEIENNRDLKNRVFFLGKVPDETIFSFYNSTQVKALIMPNLSTSGDIEGFGIVALEAAIAGIPVIASNIEGLKSSVIPEKTGLLLPEKEKTAFSKRIPQINRENWDRSEQTVKELFDWENIGKKWELELKRINKN